MILRSLPARRLSSSLQLALQVSGKRPGSQTVCSMVLRQRANAGRLFHHSDIGSPMSQAEPTLAFFAASGTLLTHSTTLAS